MTENQRAILEALAGHWDLLRWRCNDGTHRWHMGVDEVDGRSLRGLLKRGLIEWGGDYVGGQLVLTAAGRATTNPQASANRAQRVEDGT